MIKELEKESKKRNLQNIILEVVSVAGIIGIGLVAPEVLVAMKKVGILPKPREKESILRSKDRLLKRGMLEIKNGNLKITGKGKFFLIRNTYGLRGNKNKIKWDGKWRVLIFDIPEKLRFVRDQIRLNLMTIGFKRLQNSVWIYPYPCEDLVSLLKADLEIGKDLLYMIVDTLEDDESIRKYFNLK